MKTQANINLIFKHTHKDYKGITGGEKSILKPASLGGGNCAIKDLPDETFERSLDSAKRRESQDMRDEKLRTVMKKHGLIDSFEETMQWRETESDVIQFASFSNGQYDKEAFIADLQGANIVYV